MLTFCTYEDRAEHIVGLKLLAVSLERFADDFEMVVVRPAPDARMTEWLAAHAPRSRVVIHQPAARGWSVKPDVLLHLFDRLDADRLIWVDSDVVIAGDPEPFFAAAGDTLVLQQDMRRSAAEDDRRTTAWGLSVVRRLPVRVNTGTVGVTRDHRDLLATWSEMMRDERYLDAQLDPCRVGHLRSDQDVLEGLLMSERGRDTQVTFSRTGTEQVHDVFHWAHTPRDRLSAVLGRRSIWLIHALANKPWITVDDPDMPLNVLRPYPQHARRFRHLLDEPTGWLEPGTSWERLWTAAGGASYHLAGFGFFLPEWCRRPAQRLKARWRRG